MTAVLAVATGVVVAVLTWSALPSATPDAVSSGLDGVDGRVTDTPSGPLTPADRAMLVAVRQAGLWQAPLAQQARLMAGSAPVRAVAAATAADHETLAPAVLATATRLGVLMPSMPTTQQQSWLAEMSGETGADYDLALVNRLHTAATTTLAQVDRVRAGTGNSEVAALAANASELLDRQLGNLERTGLVVPAAIDDPAATDRSSPLGVVALLAAVCVFGLVRTNRQPRRHRNLILAPLNPRREL
ncbi:MAG: DUF4142 domain-containing protein [Pseudonocardia sp.]